MCVCIGGTDRHIFARIGVTVIQTCVRIGVTMIHTCVRIGVRIVSFLENFAYALNKWPLDNGNRREV